jgi:hypothetical protein
MLNALKARGHKIAAGVGAGALSIGQAMAQDPTVEMTLTEFDTVIDPQSIGTAAFTIGGTALLVVFAIAGGFRVANKTFSRVTRKI